MITLQQHDRVHDMAWAVPEHSHSEVDAAGRALVRGTRLRAATKLISTWRSAHGFPLNTLQVGLRQRASRVDAGSLVSQRLKRRSSIKLELELLEWLTLSEMQDIAGCRAIVGSTQKVDELVGLFTNSRIRHQLIHTDA